MTTAFVLGGGGLLGAHEVGMLRALSEAGVRPDLVVGTSIGAINGAFVAADPAGAAARLSRMWRGDELRLAFSERIWGRAARLMRSGTHLHSLEPLRRMLDDALPGSDFADLQLPFQCVAASIETASARWFSSGPAVPAVLASCAVPGLLPPVEIDGTHYFDGGLVDSIPVGRAVALGASTVYVLQVGRIESPLAVPTRPWEVGLVAFEIARRHRFHEEMSSLPDNVQVHVLPTGGDRIQPGLPQFRHRERARVGQSIERAYTASASYLAALARHLSGLLSTGGARCSHPGWSAGWCWPRWWSSSPSASSCFHRCWASSRCCSGWPGSRARAACETCGCCRSRWSGSPRRSSRCSSCWACGSSAGSAAACAPSPIRAATTRSSGGSSTCCTGGRKGRTGCGSRSRSRS